MSTPNWESIARACRRYLDCFNDPIADNIALGSVSNDLRIIVEREHAKLRWDGSKWAVDQTGQGNLASKEATAGTRVYFHGGPWAHQSTELDHVVAPVFGPGHEIGNHYWLDTKSDPPTYHWDGTEWLIRPATEAKGQDGAGER